MNNDYLAMQQLAANTIRGLAMDGVQKANSGHPGMPMGMADTAVVLWTQFLKYNPQDPKWFDRDRFILSAGHGSMLLYSLLHLTGFPLTMDDLKQFRQWNSMTPGHPESHLTPGVETTTGPLGQGITNAVGFALAERWLAERFNKDDFDIVDHYTYVIAGDGDLMEGISHEACSLAGHLGLGKLIVLYDDNGISIDGSTDLAFTEDVIKRFEAYGWQTMEINGHDPKQVANAIRKAQADVARPSLIACKTTIGFGSPNRAGTSKAHGEPLGEAEVKLAKEKLGLPVDETFYVPDGVREFMGSAGLAGVGRQKDWEAALAQYAEEYPAEAVLFRQMLNDELPPDWTAVYPKFEVGKGVATRASSGQVLNTIALHVPQLLGGSADLTGSNKTDLKGEAALTKNDFSGRYIHFGVREHGMGGIMNGIALHGGIRPYGGGFLVFSDYMRGSVRLAALMGVGVIYVFTHDSIGLGEDGPTHQPIEHVMSLRTIPNLHVIRPAEAGETAVAWRAALESKHAPTALILTRQNLPTLDRRQYPSADGLLKGAYVLSDADDFQVILIGTGSEVQIALDAQKLLAEKGVAARVVSMPCWELFSAQPDEYKEAVLPAAVTARVSIEAGVTLGWERYVGSAGTAIGIDHFGASAPYEVLYEQFGLTATAVAEAALSLVG
ncbi:MAG: transketolase [Ardenticatenaceae bacterium]|nr:transketolase [Ardenticatenaceae bacterium]